MSAFALPSSAFSPNASSLTGSSASGSPVLSLHDLAAFDPRAGGLAIGGGAGQGSEHRLLCPLCGPNKPKDSAHRSLSLNTANGMWRCYRCNQTGKVRDAWDERPVLPRRERARAALAQAFALHAPSLPSAVPAVSATLPSASMADSAHEVAEAPRVLSTNVLASSTDALASAPAKGWKHALQGMGSLEGTRGATYLQGRGISLTMARAAGTRFSHDFMGRPAVLFPLRDQQGALRGAQGRYVDGKDKPKARTVGDKKRALFVTEDALNPELPALIVTEAPLDALSLAEAGYPAVAVCGTEPPIWLHRVSAFRRVFLAFDADEAGDRAGERVAPLLESFGACCERLRPEGAKDWNALLQEGGVAHLSDWLACRVLI